MKKKEDIVEKKSTEENLTLEDYYNELNKYAQELKYKDVYDLRDNLLDRTTQFFVNGMTENKIEELGGTKEATYSIKSILKNITTDTLNSSDINNYTPILGEQFADKMYPQSVPYSRDKIRQLLKNAEKNADEIRQASEFVRNNILQFKRVEQYFISLFSFKYYLIPKKNVNKINDFERSKRRVYDFLDSLRIREQYPRMVADAIKNGCCFYLFNKKGNIFDFMRLPVNQCRITNVRNTFGITFEVDASYFQEMYDLKMISPEMYGYYKDLIEDSKSPAELDENGNIKRDENGEVKKKRKKKGYGRTYIPISPLHGCCITVDPYKATKVPLLSALLPDSLDVLEYKNIQKQKSILETWCIIPQIIPYDEAEKPKVPLSLAKQTIRMLQNALPQGVVTFSTPLDVKNPITLQNSNTQQNIIGLGEQNFFSAVGVAGNVMGVGEAKNQAVIDFSNMTDMGFVDYLYNQFTAITNLLMEIYVTGSDWKVYFFGNSYRSDKEAKDASTMFTTNNLPAEYLGANLGFEPQDFDRMLQMGDKSKLKDLMQPLVSQFQQSGSDSESTNNDKKENNVDKTLQGGRPKKSDEDLTESGQQARENETNGNREGF